MFLTGPGGSGKSEVINTLLTHGKGFCKLLETPFTRRTIIVTALTGVAATVIKGETTHSGAHVNRKKKFEDEHVQEWRDARLIIVDEISFATTEDIRKLNTNLKMLGEEPSKKYGGVSMVFSEEE